MPKYGLENIHNIVLLSHGGAGKTSLSEAMLFDAGAISRIGKVDDGSSTSDYDPEEAKRRISINLSLLPLQWRENKINIIDVPGYADFVGEVKASMRVSDAAIIVVCGASGVEVGTEMVWNYCEEAKLPRLIFINKMDRENADFFKVAEEIKAKLGNRCIPMQIAIGAHTGFQGVVDLLNMKAYTGTPSKEVEVPAAVKAQADSYREKLVEAIAEVDDKLLEKYLGGEEIGLEEFTGTLRQAIITGRIVPILTGSALQNVAVNRVLDTICDYLPLPKEQKVATAGGAIDPSESASLAALVFKTTADPYVGKLTFFRVYNGVISSNSQVYNSTQGAPERIGQLYLMRGKTQEPVTEIRAGDIGAVAKLNVTATGDTLCAQDKQVKLTPIVFPAPTFSEAVYPKTKTDIDKMGSGLSRLAEEDPTLKVHRELGTGETILSGMGDTHLSVAAEKMQRKFGVNVELAIPKVAYRETITAPSKAEHKHKKQSGGHGQYGHVLLALEPLPERGPNEFADKVVGGSVPRNYIPAVEKGVLEAYSEGGLCGYPVVGVKTTLYDGSFHPVDSSEICFKIAGSQAFKKGILEGRPILLEPIMDLKVTVPNDLTGDIIGDLNTKRAHVVGMNPDGDINVIEAKVPLAEIQRYAIDLKSMTQGRATYTMEFERYEEVPANITQKLVAQKQAEKAEKS
ncbi:MAG: translation elongation factor G [Chloroflexi bacterium RBG_13_52_12]|nr:MAG: translation elongation factor G [Chloroflexi bacterium RBG_13_52_12]